jgi:chromosome segregation protein
MRIRRLEIAGFKSFADRVVVRFGDGITGVVGPNGCGKSNIVDSIRWCMGEMSAKNLRGRAMQDVIFAGAESRGPLGMAEVSLVFENDGNVPPQYAPLTEIEVTRRLHRDGTSEYLINKIQARLRDVTDLFLGTGVGTRAYSIIEQGRIGFIVSARPEDRRTIIEEVAGITKFKARKKAAERRMEATGQNLLRVNDIVTELDRQLQTLRRQAKKAERYRRLKEELKDLELHQATMELLRLRGVDLVSHDQHVELSKRLQTWDAVSAADEAVVENDRIAMLEEERRLQAEQQSSAESDTRLAALERDLEHWRRQLAEAIERAATASTDVEEAKQRLSASDVEGRELGAQVGEISGSLSGERAQIDRLTSEVSGLQAKLGELDGEIEKVRRDAVEHVHQVAQQRSLAQNLERQRTDVWQRLAQLTEERDNEGERRGAAASDKAELESSRSERESQLTDWRARQADFKTELERVARDATQGEARVLDLKGQLALCQSRLESFQTIARRMEGFSEGVRNLMGADNTDGSVPTPKVPGIDRLVADIFEARPEYERAIEAVLGDKLQCVVVDSAQSGVNAIDYLKGCAGGRGGFIPKAARAPQHPASSKVAGSIGPALLAVAVKPGYEAIAEYLLGDVLLVDTLAHAVEHWPHAAPGQTMVTLEGEVVNAGGALAGGSDTGAGLLAKRREMRELDARNTSLIGSLAAATEAQEALAAERLQLEINVQQLDKDIHATELEQVEVDKDLEAAVAEMSRLSDRIEVLGYEISHRHEDLAAIDREQATAKAAAEAAESGHLGVESRLQGLQEARRATAVELDIQTQTLTNARVMLAGREEKLTSAQAALERLSQAERDLAARVERGVGAIQDDTGLVVQLKARLADGQAQASQTVAEAQKRRELLSSARAAYEAMRAAINDKEQGIRARRREVDAIKERVGQLALDEQRVEMERRHLIEQMAERHEVDLLKVAGDYHLRPLPAAEAAERRNEIDRAIKNIGPVNLTAIEECNEIETRFSFLARQRDDLQAAMESLKRAIQRINRASRERFQEAFTAVNDMFMKVFPRLFRGGEARLELSETEDLLEAGVDIVAQPPGKKLQSVGLLSGGEKALTATALVFAIFLVKPSPFCILDEVDAPLDDANVGRFNDMLREISRISQFIVITHNKNTMTEADRLYGITMEEPGLSKVVSVQLQERQVEAA